MNSHDKKFLRVLMADDDEEDVFLVRELLKEGLCDLDVELDWAASSKIVFTKFKEKTYDLCLLDFRLGTGDGIELLKSIRNENMKIPVIMLTGVGDQKVAVEAMKLGAVDFVDKGHLEVGTFAHAVRRALKLYQEENHRREMEETLAAQGTLVQALSKAVSGLLMHTGSEAAISRSLATMGAALQADWVGLFLHGAVSSNGTQEWHIEQQWMANPESEFNDRIQDTAGALIQEAEFQKWVQDLRRSRSVLEPENPGLLGLRICLMVPIQVQNIFYGFLVFGRFERAVPWTKAEKSILVTFVASLGWELKRDREERAFRSLVQGTSGQTGEGFFDALVRHLTQALGFRCAYVYEVVEYGKTLARVLKGWNGSLMPEGDPFDLVDTPAEEALAGMYCFYPEGVNQVFPHDIQLAQLKVNSYAAVPFFDSTGKVSGFLAVQDDLPMLDQERILSILRLFASRAGAELERKRTEERIRNMAYHDALTGLPNRVLFNDRLNLALLQAQRTKSQVAVIFLDFDNFKQINDNHGHSAGDLLLKEGGRRLTECLREGDTVARFGGDEFLLLLPGIRETGDVARVALKINSVIKAPFSFENLEIRSSVSIGIALYPHDGEDSKILLKKADDALFEAKKKGRDNFQFASPLSQETSGGN